MATVRIPVRHKEPLAFVASMEEDRFDELKECFQPVQGDLSMSSVVRQIAAAVEPDAEAGAVLDALIGAKAFTSDIELTQENAALQIAALQIAALQIAGSDPLELDDPQRDVLADRLTALFQLPALNLLAHSSSLRAEDEYSYCASRIFSDLRPMFGPDEDVTAVAALIRHSLKFDVHIDGRIESLLIVVNERALQEIATVVERAIRKAESLRDIAHRAGLSVIDLEEMH